MNTHKYAIAFTVEMSHEMLKTAPAAPVVMESGQQYLNAGVIALQVATFIRNIGYEARAHIDGNYELVCPLVARDAGLGELGRMGLLMTPRLGPRVRISVVTTNLPLIIDQPLNDYSVIDFCTLCKKCADACPSQAISFGPQEEINGIKRWQINQEKCFTLWSALGTDCGRCISVCPYAHPDNLLHNIVRTGIKNSSVFRKVALHLDDYFYGRKPAPAPLPDWVDIPTVTDN
jgi:reductive dehalogenase